MSQLRGHHGRLESPPGCRQALTNSLSGVGAG